ncbi:Uncharacterised protein [Klebsiella pneumoniae]|nr:Uncharacterised protein [Klebsiella pneumoniae]SVR95275.1 Uncharacterised protein [Klebsiella pneumoniae]SYE59934.1 Uncharacterised protein [Klebsiella pneumoniae]
MIGSVVLAFDAKGKTNEANNVILSSILILFHLLFNFV